MLKDSSMWDDDKSVKVEVIWIFMLLLKTYYYLNIKEKFTVPSYRRNFISISILDKFGYSCSIENNQFDIFLNSNIVGTNSLSSYDNLY